MALEYMKTFDVPILLLGGGGYTVRNVARSWTYETAIAVGQQKELAEGTQISLRCGVFLANSPLPKLDLPFNEYFHYYGPEYRLDVPPTNMENQNTREYLEKINSRIVDNLRNIPFAPSVQMQGMLPILIF